MRITHTNIVVVAAVLAGTGLWAQGRNIGSEWQSSHADAQRTGWVRNDPNITPTTVASGDFKFQWKRTLSNEARGLQALNQGVTVNGVGLFLPVSLVTGSANNLFAIDNDSGFPIWQRHFDGPLPAGATLDCPGGITGGAGRLVDLSPMEPVAVGTPQAPGRGSYQSAVGDPGTGIPGDLGQRAARGGQAPAPARGPQPPGPAAGGGPVGTSAEPPPGLYVPTPRGPGNLGRLPGPAYVISSDGVLHTIGWTTGVDVERPVPVVPPNARLSDLTVVDGRLYFTTSGGCGGAPNAVWSIDLASDAKTAVSWRTNGGSPVGPVAFTSTGAVIASVGAGQTAAGGYANAVVALDPKTMALKDWYTSATADFVSAPVVFPHGDREVVAAATRDGRILLLDATSLGGANHGTALHVQSSVANDRARFAPGTLTTFQEVTIGGPGAVPTFGPRWLLVPVAGRLGGGISTRNGAVTNGAVVAFRVVDRGGRPALQAGWASADLVSPAAPIVANDVVFVASTGLPAVASGASPDDVTTSAKPAVLYALDGRTGRQLWTSGDTMTSFMPGATYWLSNSQVHVATHDNTVYQFGFSLERP